MTADTEIATGEVVPYSAGTMDEYRPRIVMAPEDAKALDDQLRANMKAVLRDNVDYGVIPGTGSKPTLLKPGAEKLLQWFGFGHTMEQVEAERDANGGWQGVTYRCTVTKAMPDGRVVVVGTCEGYAGYDEDRFYLSTEAATAKERANAERYRRQVNPSKCVEYRAPRNSVIKMAQKRALVGAALQATSASTLFTQDVEDIAQQPDTGPDVGAIARALIGPLPAPVRTALDRWRESRGMPGPGSWDAEQWCMALVEAGRLDARKDPWPDGPPPAAAANVQDGTLGDWGARIDEIGSEEDAERVIQEAEEAHSGGSLDGRRHKAIVQAARIKGVRAEAQAAA